MSQDHGQQRGRQGGRQTGAHDGAPGRPSRGLQLTPIDRPPRQGRHTSFDRPSLFAQDAADEPADAQRVPILSTLESTQGAGPGAHKARRGPTPDAHETPLPRQGRFGSLAARWGDWQAKALMGLMAAGILSLLTAFVLLLLDRSAGHEARADTHPASADMAGERPISVDRRNPLAALVAPASQTAVRQAPSAMHESAMHDPIARQAAVIEDVPEAKVHTRASADVRASIGGPQTLLANTPPGAGLPSTQGKVMDAAVAITAPPRPGQTIDKDMDKTTAQSVARRPAKPNKDEDVALLEAVLAHSASRKPPAPAPALSVTEALRRCGQLEGAASATCRARVCVGNPTAPACHQDP